MGQPGWKVHAPLNVSLRPLKKSAPYIHTALETILPSKGFKGI